MWADRFRTHLAERLSERPEIANVTEISTGTDQHPDLRVEAADGTVFVLRVVRSSTGGEDFSQPERIIEKGFTKTGS